MSNYKDLKKELEKMYPVKAVSTGYWYYTKQLTEKCMGMFQYTGLPESLPAEELEFLLIRYGSAPIFQPTGSTELVTSKAALSGVDKYYKPTQMNYAQPVLGSGTRFIGKDCAVLYNSFMDNVTADWGAGGLSELIARYARMLADIDASLNIATINRRATALNVAKTQQVAKSVDKVMDELEAGNTKTISEDSILDCFHTFPFDDVTGERLNELITVKRALMAEFFAEIGVKSGTDKKERLITDEVATQNQLLLINIDDMLKSRQKGVDMANDIFGTSITVSIDEDYDPTNFYMDTDGGVEDVAE